MEKLIAWSVRGFVLLIMTFIIFLVVLDLTSRIKNDQSDLHKDSMPLAAAITGPLGLLVAGYFIYSGIKEDKKDAANIGKQEENFDDYVSS
jgi:hypothetical protein